jgi:hypothetical protein
MNRRRAYIWILLASLSAGLTGCTSEATRERQIQAEARRRVAQEDQDLKDQETSDEGQRALVLKEQDRLDGVEQKRTGNVYAHSCRKVTEVNYILNANSVDTSGCSPDQLKIEKEAEQNQARDKIFADAEKQMRENREKYPSKTTSDDKWADQ